MRFSHKEFVFRHPVWHRVAGDDFQPIVKPIYLRWDPIDPFIMDDSVDPCLSEGIPIERFSRFIIFEVST